MFPLLLQVQTQTKYENAILLITSFGITVRETSDVNDWVRNTSIEFSASLLSLQEEDELSELQCD